MSGEVSLFGVYVPGLLLLAVIALVATTLCKQVLAFADIYRLAALRPLVDVALFVLVLAATALLTGSPDFAS